MYIKFNVSIINDKTIQISIQYTAQQIVIYLIVALTDLHFFLLDVITLEKAVNWKVGAIKIESLFKQINVYKNNKVYNKGRCCRENSVN